MSLPVIGVGVIAAATAWELRDACLMMGEMRALDAAFNPDDPVREDEVCGMEVPTRAELWEKVRASPGAVWAGAQGLYDDLPELSAAYGRGAGWLGGLWDQAFGEDAPAAPPLPPEGLLSGPDTPSATGAAP